MPIQPHALKILPSFCGFRFFCQDLNIKKLCRLRSAFAPRPQVEVIGDGAEIPLVHANTFATGSSLCKASFNDSDFTHVTG
jgi:hypothetical protein